MKVYQQTYDRSHHQRKRIFEYTLQEFHQVHCINELRRASLFVDQQRSRRVVARGRDEKYTSRVKQEVRSSVARFESDEVMRANEFLDSEQKDSTAFIRDQERRSQQFDRIEESLQRRMREDEGARKSRFVAWVFMTQQKLLEGVEKWEKSAKEEADWQTRTFATWIGPDCNHLSA